MKFTSIFLLLITTFGFAQNKLPTLRFDTNYYDAVDKWVAFPKKDIDSTYPYGFIYIDSQAGFTFNYESRFKLDGSRLEGIKKRHNAQCKI
jgi:hypothetical protein